MPTYLFLFLCLCCLACNTKKIDTKPTKIIGLKPMVLVRGGFFRQGNDKGTPSEKPVRTVALDDFYMDITPVTYQDFAGYVQAGGEKNAQWYDENYHKNDLPLTGLTWHQAADFCNWRSKLENLTPVYTITEEYDEYGYPIFSCNTEANGYRLPTEAEFEYAASCGETQETYPWGETFSHQFANFDIEKSNSKGKWRRLAPVHELHQNTWGLYGMSGNQWHWCNDWFDADEYAKNTNIHNPQGARKGTVKSLRGGSWGSNAQVFLTVYKRSYNAAGNYNFDIGFRCVRTAKNVGKDSILTLQNPKNIAHTFYKEKKYHKISGFQGNVYSEEFVGILGKYIADYYPNCLYFHQKVDKQAILNPRQLAELIVEVTKMYQIHPLILTGIFAAESGFGSCSVPRWYNNPLAYHWQNKLIVNGEPEYKAPIGLKNEKFATLKDNFQAFCKGIRKPFYIAPARQNLEAFHKLYVGYDAHAWMLPITRVYRDLLGIELDAKTPNTQVGRFIYMDWLTFEKSVL
jgi:formylglycine-generating enzyme required for sulfatase activity